MCICSLSLSLSYCCYVIGFVAFFSFYFLVLFIYLPLRFSLSVSVLFLLRFFLFQQFYLFICENVHNKCDCCWLFFLLLLLLLLPSPEWRWFFSPSTLFNYHKSGCIVSFFLLHSLCLCETVTVKERRKKLSWFSLVFFLLLLFHESLEKSWTYIFSLWKGTQGYKSVHTHTQTHLQNKWTHIKMTTTLRFHCILHHIIHILFSGIFA